MFPSSLFSSLFFPLFSLSLFLLLMIYKSQKVVAKNYFHVYDTVLLLDNSTLEFNNGVFVYNIGMTILTI